MIEQQPGSTHATIGSARNSAIAVGAGASATVSISSSALSVSENSQLTELLQQLKEQVAAGAPADLRDEAVRKTTEISQALSDDEPDLGRLESVRNWFVRRLPALSGAVVSLIIHPLVGRIVEAAGDALAAEYRRRFTENT